LIAGAVGRGAISALTHDAATDATAAAEASSTSCVLAVETTEGPYFLAGDLIRQDISKGIPGVPLKLCIGIQNVTACSPLANTAVDNWHGDAQGFYSGICEEHLTTTFWRGIQITRDAGFVEFDTIYPGWYVNRTVHIHMKVMVDGTVSETYDGGTIAHTDQLFFDDEISIKVFSSHEACSGRDETDRTVNDEDNILGDHEDEPGFIVAITGAVEDGHTGTIWIGVDPEATPAATGDGSAGEGGPDGTRPNGQ